MRNSDDDMTSKDDKIFEALFKVAADEAVKEEMEALPSLEELNKMHPPSNTLNNKIHSIINKEEQSLKRKKFLRSMKKIAAVIGFIFVISSAVLMSVEAYRNFIINIFINVQDDHIAFEFGQDESGANFNEHINFNMLEEFELIVSQSMEALEINIYENSAGEQIIIQRHIASYVAAAIDNEARNFSIIYLEGQRIHFFEATDAGDPSVAMWQDRNDVISIHSNIATEELLLLAKNIISN